MKITKAIVIRLIELMGGGIQNGAGDMSTKGHFCIQQAVSMALEHPELSDHPRICNSDVVNSWGIQMNDKHWRSSESRAKGMQRFAVAELGSNRINEDEWRRKLSAKWNAAHPNLEVYGADDIPERCRSDKDRIEACNMAAEVLKELDTEGSRFLYLLDPDANKEEKEELKKLFCLHPVYQSPGRFQL